MKNVNNFQIAKTQPQGVAYHLLDSLPILSLALLMKVLLIKKACKIIINFRLYLHDDLTRNAPCAFLKVVLK